MKKYLVACLIAFLLIGCSQKKQVKKTVKVPDYKESITILAPNFEAEDYDDKTIIEEFLSNESIITEEIIEDKKTNNINIAFIYPSSLVFNYAKTSLNTISGYLLFKNANYHIYTIDTVNESYSDIESAFKKLKDKNIKKVIALFTPNAINSLNRIVTNDFIVYLPLIEKKDTFYPNDNLIFGSISYTDQLIKLNTLSSDINTLFYQETYLGNKIKDIYDSIYKNNVLSKKIDNNETNFKEQVDDEEISESTLFLNTDLVKSSIILSQMNIYETTPNLILAPQTLYDPLLLTLTQPIDRENLVIANSIGNVIPKLKDSIYLIGGNVTFEWVDYSTLVGIDYLLNGRNSSLIKTKIHDNEVFYIPRLYKVGTTGFYSIK